MKPKNLAIILFVYVLCALGSFAAFRMAFASGKLTSSIPGAGGLAGLISPSVPKAGTGLEIDENAPKTEVCPLNGQKYTTVERQRWEKRRPLAVMIENHTEARPQSGMGKADVVYEAIAEGGITRFMGVFLCDVQAKDTILAPVRSARQYFIDWASDYNYPLYVHVGGSNGTDTDPRVRALEHLTDYGWTAYNDLNQFSIGYPVFVRNYNRVPGKDLATEHTMESSTERLWTYAAEKRGLTNLDAKGKDWEDTFVKWEFTDDAGESERGMSANAVAYDFWSGYSDFSVAWAYDKASNVYKRSMAGAAHLDANDQKQIEVKNVIVMLTKEQGPIDVHKHMYYQTQGLGKAILFQNGKQEEITWAKKDRTSRLTFIDKKGRPVKLVRGKIWISVMSDKNSVNVQ